MYLFRPVVFMILLCLSMVASNLLAQAQEKMPAVTQGKLERLPLFESNFVTKRHIDIWLPDGYPSAGKYAVLYMHDGQMLYDSTMSWNKQAWEVDETAGSLITEGLVKPFIVVGIWNSGTRRHADYFPQKPFEQLTETEKDTISAQLERAGRSKGRFKPESDKYLEFIVEELKPYIISHYAVSRDPKYHVMAGSSMGGLISMYAFCEYPDQFGGVACLSTHWPGSFTLDHNPMPAAFLQYLKANLPANGTRNIYFDCGDQTLDVMYPSIQQQVDAIMQSKGYDAKHWQTQYFPGEDHSEGAWKKRFRQPLIFLLGKNR